MKRLPNHPKSLQERAYEQLKAWDEIANSSDDEEVLTRQITVSSASGSISSKTVGTN